MIEVQKPLNPKAVDLRDPKLIIKRVFYPHGWRAYESATGSGERALQILRKHDLSVGAIRVAEDIMIVDMKDVVWVK